MRDLHFAFDKGEHIMPKKEKTLSDKHVRAVLSVLQEISAIIQTPVEHEVFESVLASIRKAIPYTSATLFLLDKETQQLEEVSRAGEKVDLIQSVRFDLGPGFSAWVAKQKKPVLISNLHRKMLKEGKAVRSFLSVPLMVRDQLIGVLNLSHQEPEALGKDEFQLAHIIAAQVAFAIERMLYENELRDKNEQLEEAHKRLKEAQEELIELKEREAISQVVISLNHEINNPLTTIVGNAQFLLMTADKVDKGVAERLETITKEANRISQATHKLSNLKKLETDDYLSGRGEKMIDLSRSV
ncbi:MAG: hypothetical protein B1H02_00285 [Candidatus Latescibacteria bacterium 4484_107]|nr:MAG: hypothetical protein B1H02_00285 [Candidatus Latescibacteria bacterium 4484_107]